MRCAPYFFLLGSLILAQFGTLARAADDFLDPAVAFKFSATEKPGEVDVTYKIADGYYMYRERFAFATRNGTTTIGEPQLPAGHVKFDQTFNKNVETYRNELTIRIPGQAGSRTVRSGGDVARLRRCRHLLSADGARLPRERRSLAAGR